jgi:hypothetical protein
MMRAVLLLLPAAALLAACAEVAPWPGAMPTAAAPAAPAEAPSPVSRPALVAAAQPAPPPIDQGLLQTPPPGLPRAGAEPAAIADAPEAELLPAMVADATPPGRLGTTVASLGPPADAGLWVETPLVHVVMQGRVEDKATGRIVAVELRPSGGEPGSGSQISLAALQALGLPLTALPELVVYGG